MSMLHGKMLFSSIIIDLYLVLLITLPFHELDKQLLFPVGNNNSWLTLIRKQTIQSKKETNYHSCTHCGLFCCSSMGYSIAFRKKNITQKRWYSILIVKQFLYRRLRIRSCSNSRKQRDCSHFICFVHRHILSK